LGVSVVIARRVDGSGALGFLSIGRQSEDKSAGGAQRYTPRARSRNNLDLQDDYVGMSDQPPPWRGWATTAGLATLLIGGFAILRPGPFQATITSTDALLRIGALVAAMIVLGQVLKRVLHNAAVRMLIMAVPALAIAVLIVRPYFTDKEVHEALPTTVAALHDPSPAPPSTVAPPAAQTIPSSEVAATTVAPSGPVKVTTGKLSGIDHRASGEAAVYRLQDGTAFVRLEDIDVQNGPDYVLYLAPGIGADSPGGINLGALKGNKGSQNYELPTGVDLGAPHTVLIWCRAFSVPVANSTQAPA
jgi:hypothetical protein